MIRYVLNVVDTESGSFFISKAFKKEITGDPITDMSIENLFPMSGSEQDDLAVKVQAQLQPTIYKP